MTKVSVDELIMAVSDGNFLWILIPIFFIGIITDKYQEEFGTSVGNAISNGALIIFTGFSWLQIISTHNIPSSFILSQTIFSILVIVYGLAIIFSGFKTGNFAKTYGRIRVITFMLMFFTIMIYVPLLYNFISIIVFVLIFPLYYAFISELIRYLPSASPAANTILKDKVHKDKFKKIQSQSKLLSKYKRHFFIWKEKIKEYLK